MIDRNIELLIHRDIVAKLPHMKEKVGLFDYLIQRGFSPTQANMCFLPGTREFDLAVDGYKYWKSQQ